MRGRRRNVPRCKALEARQLLTTGDFSYDLDSAGVTTDDAGHVFVSYVDNSDVLAGQKSMIAVYDPIAGSHRDPTLGGRAELPLLHAGGAA